MPEGNDGFAPALRSPSTMFVFAFGTTVKITQLRHKRLPPGVPSIYFSLLLRRSMTFVGMWDTSLLSSLASKF